MQTLRAALQTARTILKAGRARLNGVSAHLFSNLSGSMHKGTCPGWFARLKHAHAWLGSQQAQAPAALLICNCWILVALRFHPFPAKTPAS